MKYSIIIPTLNEEKILENLLKTLTDSSLKKKYDYEIIISDGGSKDSTVVIAKNHTNKICFENSANTNIAKGRNLGASIADGDILIFLNADIVIPSPEKLFNEIKFKLVDENKNYVAYTCAVNIHPEEQKITDKIFMNFYNYYFHFLNIIGVGMGRGECQAIRKNIFYQVNGYNENLAAGEDFDLFRRVRKIGKIFFSHDVTIYESPRRYRKYGHLFIFLSWLLNSIFVIFTKKSYAKKWEEVR